MKQLYPTNFTFTFRLLPLYRNTSLFLLIFLLNFSFGFGQEVTNPSLIHDDKIDIDNVNISALDLSNLESKANRLVISTDFNSKGEKFVLTFGNGIQKVVDDNDTEVIIPGNLLFSPLDFAIDSQDRFYVANAASNNRKILVFDSEGTSLPSETIGNGAYGEGPNRFKGPTGIAFDSNNNLYIADNYSGDNPEASERGHVKVYFANGNFTEFHNVSGDSLNYPYRIAANSDGRIFLSEVGPNNGRVQVIDLDSNLNPVRIDILEGPTDNIGSPGDIIIDNEDLIYIADFGDEVSLRTILEARNEPLNLIGAVGDIQDGIEEEIFRIRVYKKDLSYKGYILDEIDLPVDLAFGACGKLSVNNLNVTGSLFTGYNFDFDLEIYSRTPYLDTDLPIAKCIPSGKEFTLQNGKVVLTPEDINDGSYDNCGIDSMELARSEFDTTGTYTVSLTVTDEAGNFAICATNIEIVEGVSQDPSVTCPDNTNLPELSLDQNCDYELPPFTDIIETENFNDLNFSTSENRIGNILNVEVEVLNGSELIETCELQFDLVDETPPVITSPDDFTREIPAGEDSIEINYDLPEFSDNCSENLTPVLISGPASGSQFEEGTYTIEFQVTDDADNIETCDFTITVTQADAEPIVTCPGNSVLDELELGENCNYTLPEIEQYIQTENFGDDNFTIIDENINDNILSVEVEVLDGEELIETCELRFELVDQTPPTISCPQNITREIPAGEDSIVINYNLPEVSDNCSENLIPELLSGPESGTEFEEGTYTIEFQVTDDADNIKTCDFTITVTQEEPAPYNFECIGELTVNLGEDAQNLGVKEIPTSEFIISDTSNLDFELDDQQFTCEDIGTNPLTIKATNKTTGEEYDCTVDVTVKDVGAPLIICPAEPITINLPEEGYKVEDFFENRISDNCNSLEELELVQDVEPGTVLDEAGTYTINLTATDTYNNVETCEIIIILEVNNSTAPQFEDCPTLIQRNVSTDECEALVMFDVPTASDDSGELAVNLVSELGSGDLFPVGTTTVTYEATGENGERITCSFEVMVVDNIPPSISCPGDQTENFDPETGFEVPNYESWATFSDNCGEVSFRQEPEAGAIIFQDTTVQLFAEDANEQVANCSFELQLTEANVLNIFCQIDQNVSPDEDCSFTLPDYTDTAQVSLPGATITQSPPEGTVIKENTQVKLTATLNGETDECFFMVNLVDNENPVANCVSGYVVNLDESGNATLAPEMLDNNSTDNCGIVSMALSQINFTRADIGEVPITLTVRDDAGNMDTCETTVEVVDENSGEFECRENVVVSLNENGEAMLSLQELYTGNASGLTLEASRLNFSCSDLGMVQIQLDYSGAQTGSCTINVEVRDEIPPFINTDIVELTLDNEGFAYLEEDDVLAENNCGQQFIYRFSKSVFNCEDVGLNTVNVEVEDASGNIAEKNIEVRVNGEACEIPDNEDLDFLFIYPNPNNGTFTIATPEGMQVEQVRVFDSRGRFILQKEYKDIARFYRMTIEGVESSVYTLQIFTNEGVVVKRVIISQ